MIVALRDDRRPQGDEDALTVRWIETSDVVALIEGAGLARGESNLLLVASKCLFSPRKHVARERGCRTGHNEPVPMFSPTQHLKANCGAPKARR